MMKIRQGTKEDLPQALELIRELAIYEKAENEVENTVESMLQDGFGEQPVFGFHVADDQGKIVGISIYYYRYSTWKGKCLYLEDLVVNESYRGKGIGKLLFDATALRAKEANCNLLNWQVLDWNEPAINFYKKINAQFDNEWINCRLTREQLDKY
ncbi:GNAT family N-acetyltransferase [Fulvivirgaceae bacterium BMA10]|uniref:GNAT family N-acetyltransferase n=1 Tax=Splendidivirga corallicola TaxID=3051826 RepID=A0ABT8KTI7_9BACT|nr:GNAT family N-acetyltransferase [Fulvivirgaceae bacterium BMA10]